MESYSAHIQKILDNLIIVGEIMKESEIVLTVIGGLGPDYASFVTSLCTCFDHAMMFVVLQVILMD